MVQLSFNAAHHEPATGSPVLPEGWHDAVITATETKRAKPKKDMPENPNNVFLACATSFPRLQQSGVIRFNLWNDNPEAVRIANGQFSKLLHVLGIFGECNDSSLIHNRPFQVYATVQSDGGRTSNNFTDYRYADGREWSKNPGNAPAGAPPNPQTGAPAGYGAPPAPPPGYGAPPPAPPAPGGFPGAPGYGAPGAAAPPPPAPPPGYPQPGQAPAPQQGGYPPPQPGYGQAPPAPGYGAPPAPSGPVPGYPPPAGPAGYGAPNGQPPAWPGAPR